MIEEGLFRRVEWRYWEINNYAYHSIFPLTAALFSQAKE